MTRNALRGETGPDGQNIFGQKKKKYIYIYIFGQTDVLIDDIFL